MKTCSQRCRQTGASRLGDVSLVYLNALSFFLSFFLSFSLSLYTYMQIYWASFSAGLSDVVHRYIGMLFLILLVRWDFMPGRTLSHRGISCLVERCRIPIIPQYFQKKWLPESMHLNYGTRCTSNMSISATAAALIRPIPGPCFWRLCEAIRKKEHVGIILRRLTRMTNLNGQSSWESFCRFLKSCVH